MRYAFVLLALLLVTAPAHANDQVRVITSKHSVKVTLDKLSAILTKRGIKVAARVNHAAGAKAAGLELPPTELLIFGNPKLGTPLMQTNPLVGLDLPMKVLAWQDKDGTVKVAYTTPAALKARFGVDGRDKVFETMTKALDGLTAAAIADK